ncbi:MAG: hypothetical protein V4641_31400 [Pseudomonadota bacterium]
MNDFANLRALATLEQTDRVMVARIDLVELLAEVDALRTGGAAKPASKYTAEFEEAWTLYPSRPGNSKAAAFKAWSARLKAGATALEMIDGTAKYAAYVKAERTEVNYIKQAATFYGPGEHFTADWTPRRAIKPVGLTDITAANNAEAKRRLFGGPPDDGMTIDAS